MKRHKRRIGIWFFIFLALAIVAGYLYLSQSKVIAPRQSIFSLNKPVAIIYLRSENSQNTIVRHDIANNEDKILLKAESIDSLLSLNPTNNLENALLLSKKGSKITLSSISLDNGNSNELYDFTAENPKAVFLVNDKEYGVIKGDGKTVAILDKEFKEIKTISAPQEITFIASDNKGFQYSTFDGTKSTLWSLLKNNKEATATKTVTGKVYHFNNHKILYAKKQIVENSDEADPTGKIYWKIAVQEISSEEESIISEGDFDTNPITDDGYEIFAYLKKYGSNNQTDGRIFFVNSNGEEDRISAGTPLMFSYQ